MRNLIQRMREIAKEYRGYANERREEKIDRFLWFEVSYKPNLVINSDYYRLGYDEGVSDALAIMASRVEGKLNEGS